MLLIFDEFPVDDLVGPDGRIDAARFPNFAKLAATSTWFRSGTTVYDSTTKAVPAILDAKLPRQGTIPGYALQRVLSDGPDKKSYLDGVRALIE